MAALKRISIALALVALAFSSVDVATAVNQLPLGAINCTLATVPNSVRAEGIADRVGDTRLDCTNDGSTDNGDTDYQQYLQANFRLRFNTNVTSMITETSAGGDAFTEALLVINDNNSKGSELTSKLPSCDGLAADDLRYPCPQNGVLLTQDTLIWDGVKVPVPGAPNNLSSPQDDGQDADSDYDCVVGKTDNTGCFDQTTTLRFTNVRVNATAVPESGTVTVSVNIASSFSISLPNRNGDVADAFKGLTAALKTTVAGLQCDEFGADLSESASVELSEGFATAFKTIGVPTFRENAHSAENGYWIDSIGSATQATQFIIRLTSLPEGITYTMPAYIAEGGSTGVCAPVLGGGDLCLKLVSSSGPTGGVASFIYEVIEADPFRRQLIAIPIYVAWTSATTWTGEPDVTTGSVDVSFYPISAVFVADNSSPRPRFIDSKNDPKVFVSVTRCTTTLLYPFVTSSFGLDTGIAVSNTSVDWKGTAAQRGACTMHFIGKTLGATGFGDVKITEQTSVIIEGGAQLAFSLLLANSDQGIDDPVPDFQGFVVAMCDFQFAHGYAFIIDGASGLPTLAQGYLALIMQFDAAGDRLISCDPGTSCRSEALNQ